MTGGSRFSTDFMVESFVSIDNPILDDSDPESDPSIGLDAVNGTCIIFDDIYTYKAFQQIDRDNDNKVTFEEFKHWWIVTQNDGRKLRKA